MTRVVIDAGHGGSDSGAVGSKSKEKDHALAIAKKLREELDLMGIDVVMTRSSDVFIPLLERSRIANNAKASLFVSIHLNAATNRSAKGTETYYLQKNSRTLGVFIHNGLSTATGFSDRGLKTANYSVIRETHIPCVLCEVGFISNAAEEEAMLKDSFRQNVAEGIADGIVTYLMSQGEVVERDTSYTLTGSNGAVMDKLTLIEGTNYVAARKFGKWFGAKIDFDMALQKVLLNGDSIKTLIVNGTGYIPIREAAARLGLSLIVDENQRTIMVTRG